MPTDSPQPPSQIAKDTGFAQAAFEELQTAYTKDPFYYAGVYRDLKRDADYALAPDEKRADSCQKLCQLDLAVANIKANSGDKQAASVMYNDALYYLDRLKSIPSAQNTEPISRIVKRLKDKI